MSILRWLPALVLALPAGCAATPAVPSAHQPAAGAASPSVSPSPSSAATAPGRPGISGSQASGSQAFGPQTSGSQASGSQASGSRASGPGASGLGASGKGWTQDDIPLFAPPPAPERVIPAVTNTMVPYVLRVPTQQKVAFLTIDDGYLKHPEAPALMAAAHVPVTLFLTTNAIRDNPDYFRKLIDAGAVVEDHTISHPQMRGMSSTGQKHQICDSADELAGWYTRRPVLFRPPYGSKDETTLRAARDCGMKAAFMWKETVDKGKVRYQGEHRVQPGDIILMHFRPAFVKDFLAALRAIHKAGLTPALLEDYVR